MKLGTCVVSSDDNPLYIDFFPIIHRVWNDLVNIRVVLALIGETIPNSLADLADDIVLVPPIDGIHPGFQSQCVRLLLPQLLPGKEAVLVSDIDMMPMSRTYFRQAVANLPDNSFVVYRSDAIPDFEQQIAICYNAASPETWRQLIGPVDDIDEANEVIKGWHDQTTYDGKHGGLGWSTDQRLLMHFVSNFELGRVRRLTDRPLNFARLDRSSIRDRLSSAQRFLTSSRFYADYHMKRPFGEFASLNEEVAALVLAGRERTSIVHRLIYRWTR